MGFVRSGIAALATLLVVGCTPSAPEPAEPTVTPKPTVSVSTEGATPKPVTYAVASVIDGDTLDLTNGKRVRLIGIDTPERGQCGYEKATSALKGLVVGERVTLVKGARDDVDRYGRLLRYVDVGNTDAGAELIKKGLAKPRYNSTDGYGKHLREDDYARLYRDASPAPSCAPKARSQPKAQPKTQVEPWNRPGPPDLDCSDIGHPVEITGPDYHKLDRDGDGTGCDAS